MTRYKSLIVCWVLLGVLQLACFVDGCLAQSSSRKPGGNQELMDDWVRQKQQLKNRILEELRSREQLPARGHVEFEAKVKRNPAKPDDYIVEIEKFRVYDTDNRTVDPAISGSNKPPLNQTSQSPVAFPTYIRGTIDFSGRKGYPEKFIFQEVLRGGAVSQDPRSFDDLPIGAPSTLASKNLDGQQGDDRGATGNNQEGEPAAGIDKSQNGVKEPKSWWRRLLGL